MHAQEEREGGGGGEEGGVGGEEGGVRREEEEAVAGKKSRTDLDFPLGPLFVLCYIVAACRHTAQDKNNQPQQ